MMSAPEKTVFERIVAREIPAEIVYEDDRVIAIVDIAPKAPVHLLVVPRTAEHADVTELAGRDPELLAHVVAVAQRLADECCGGQFRLVFNTGADAGQTVPHVHAHVLGGGLTEDALG